MAAFGLAAFIAWKTPRAPLWVLLLASSYVISVLYLQFAPKGGLWPPSQLVGLLLDGAVLLAIREYHKEQWEFFGLGTLLAFMVTADTVQLFGALTGFPPPFSKDNFGIILECLNYLALALIGGIGLMDLVRADDHRHNLGHVRPDLLHRASSHAHARSHNPKTLRKW
jgi:hypothetical protein